MLNGKTFIHHAGALGDILLSTPCIQALKAKYGFIHLAGRTDAAVFLRDTGCADEVSSAESSIYASLYNKNIENGTREFFSQFNSAFVFTVRNGSIIAENIGKIIPETRIIITIPPDGVRMHVTEFRKKQIDFCNNNHNLSPSLKIPHEFKEKAKELLSMSGYDDNREPLIALHPGSGGKRKCWATEKYFGLIEKMERDYDPFFIVFSGPAEDADIKEKIEGFSYSHKKIFHMCDRELSTIAAVLNMCDLYVGNDSGITHLASAINGNVIALFGPTDPALWRPPGENAHVISAGFPDGSISSITVDEVYSGIKNFFPHSRIKRKHIDMIKIV